MKKKRLIRDKQWEFQFFPYHQFYMRNEIFTGWAAVNELTAGESRFWNFQKAGRVMVSGEGMTWLTLIPDGLHRSISAFFLPDGRVSAWYIDVIEAVGTDADGVLYFIDKYLDVLLTPEGDILVDDRDELDAAYESGELSQTQYEEALCEGDRIIKEFAFSQEAGLLKKGNMDIRDTEKWCKSILDLIREQISQDHFTIFLVPWELRPQGASIHKLRSNLTKMPKAFFNIDGVLDIYQENRYLCELLPEAIERLKFLVKRTKADIVVISDWRYGERRYRERASAQGFMRNVDNWDNLNKTFENAGIPITDITAWDERLSTRTEEVRDYLQRHPEKKEICYT